MSRVSGLAELIRIQILQGEFAPGERLIEVTLAESLRTSRSMLREALRLLEGRGLLVAGDGGGMRVVAPDRDELAQTLRVRAALEALSAGEAAERRRQGELGDAALERVAALVDAAEADVFADRTLHLALDGLAANRPGHVALDHLWDRVVVGSIRWRPPSSALATRDHRALLAAIAEGDAEEAAALARRHALDWAPSPR